MSKAFIKPKEAEYILSTYSKSFKDEFHKIGHCTYRTDYMYIISLCPEMDFDGNETGRVLVNHYSMTGANRVPEFIDVWERDGEVFHFKYRNLPGQNLISAEERIRILEEELEAVKKQKLKVHSIKGKGSTSQQKEIERIYEQSFELYNNTVRKIHSRKEEENVCFRESELYWALIKERDEALYAKERVERQLAEQNKTIEDSIIKLKMYEQMLKERTVPLPENVLRFSTHNARGAGRKKDPMAEVKRKKAIRLKKKGLTREEICKELDIGQTTYYRYINEDKDGK
ncbi:MAG: helix-turn-helix domain-containing protein [Eubacterium sp.]|nr:helix-turn-helix domain-containing protein [Eubacterium sp.]